MVQRQEDGEARLSAKYASRYYVAQEVMADGSSDVPTKITPCANCMAATVPIAEERREPLCPTCWATLQMSIKRAMKLGFRMA